MSNPYLTFIFKKNRAIDLGTEDYHAPKFELRSVPLAIGNAGRQPGSQIFGGAESIQPYFYLGAEAREKELPRIKLRDETPRVAARSEGMNEQLYAGLVEQAVKQSLENKAKN